MKKLLAIIALALAVGMPAAAQKYTITGQAEGTEEGDTVYMCYAQGYSLVNCDTAVIKGGRFAFTGAVPTEGYASRYIRPSHKGSFQGLCMASVILEEADIKVQTYQSDPKYKDGTVESTGRNAQLYQEYQNCSKGIGQGMDEVYRILLDKKGTDEEQKAAQAKVDSVRKLMYQAKYDFLTTHMTAPICDMMLSEVYSNMPDAQKAKLLKLFKEQMPDGANYKRLAADAAATAPTAVGQKYTDFTMKTPDGQDMKVSDLVGKCKYLLVDFWASWCGPCRAEMPHVVEAYNLFHDKGFEVLGVSLDNKQDAWVKSIADLQLPWPQMSDLQGWQCQGAKIYNVHAIPANVLIDKKGKIVARNLRGQQLIDTIGQLMK